MAGVFVISGLVCLAGAILEGLFAGSGIRARLASLRMPSYVPPFSVWIIIALVYYAICFAVCSRLLLLPPSTARTAAFGLLGAVMFINALWNYFFFRARNVRSAYMVGLGYSGIAIALFAVLLVIDRTAAWCFSPYIVYLLYANTWGYSVWKLNP